MDCKDSDLVQGGLTVSLRLMDSLDQEACYEWLLQLFHPVGLACPRCHEKEKRSVHRRHREPVLDYRCGACGRVFNAWTGTLLEKTHHSARDLVQIVRAIVDRESTAELARRLGCQRAPLQRLRGRLQRFIHGRLGPHGGTCSGGFSAGSKA